MDISEAVQALKNGMLVRRAVWTAGFSLLFFEDDTIRCNCKGPNSVKSHPIRYHPRWIPNQADILADDWELAAVFICDRCEKSIEGFQSEGATAGFYKTDPSQNWHKYAHDSGERIVCDACMLASPKYRADYGGN